MEESDVIVIGGGIAGAAAALRLQDRGLHPLVLESEARVGGRMTTDRIEGFAIDRGVTLLGNQFTRMRSLCRRFGLQPRMVPAPFSFGLRTDAETCHSFRAGHIDDILRSALLSPGAKAAFLRLSADLVGHGLLLAHGRSEKVTGLDRQSAAEYFASLGPGGTELLERMLMPGLSGPVGGNLAGMSLAAMMQIAWNVLVRGTWNLSGGVDGVPEAIAAQVPIRTGCRVKRVQRTASGVQVTVEDGGTLTARAAIFALPGNLVPALCPDLPEGFEDALSRTEYASMRSVHIALSEPPVAPFIGYGLGPKLENGVEMELEHVRAPANCPAGTGMVSLFFYPSAGTSYAAMNDTCLKDAALALLERTFPEVRGKSMFRHVVRWQNGIARFPTGRLTEMVALRSRLRSETGPYDFCGDYLDGIASESALRTGEQAADRILDRLAMRR